MGQDPLIVIAGPTASGKTGLAIDWALKIDAEIISADSQQVYRYFDIGTAKPSAEQLSRVRHHLVSVVEPHDAFSAARFGALADAAIGDIQSRNRRVIVVGGTGLYLRVLLHGVVPAPGRDDDFRRQLEAEAVARGWPALHARLSAIDPESASKIHTTDPVRITRALEIQALTGQTASSFRQSHGFATDRHAHRLFVLDPPREPLYDAINRRTRGMFDDGLIQETKGLVERGYREAPPMRSVGYVQALSVVEGRLTREQALCDAAQQTRHYAKRQYTWFKKERGAEFLKPPYGMPQGL